ncbi:MAG: AbrB/MazE/SpoVT family DNA-binding domain-containing protein [Deltaproteobacteria bacterium]|jgi:antitoxin component of MazEF toxin-antitoxin module|nr:AbrB/MazE/SpoVT family DNA-binding domain-containing protein [Deltaproteobacteria bacterium]
MRQIKISAWGNSLGFRIPRGLADSFDIQAGDVLELTPVEEGLLIKKPAGKAYRLADILDSFASSKAAPELDFGGPKGEEIW